MLERTYYYHFQSKSNLTNLVKCSFNFRENLYYFDQKPFTFI